MTPFAKLVGLLMCAIPIVSEAQDLSELRSHLIIVMVGLSLVIVANYIEIKR